MNVEFLTEYFVPVIAGIVVCILYIFRKTTDKYDRYIPLIAGVLGIVFSCWIYWGNITPVTFLSGLFSGLAATGLHEMLKNLIFDKEEK